MKKIYLRVLMLLLFSASFLVSAQEGCFVIGASEQDPWGVYTPNCVGDVEDITTQGWAGEYSQVQVSAGVAYTFSSSIDTDYLTIAANDEDVAFATGTGSVTWTSPSDQIIRFFTHKDNNCTVEEVTRARRVQCGSEPPTPANDDCENAIALTCGETASGSNDFATDSGAGYGKDVFYKYTGNGEPQLVTVSLCGSDFDTILRVFTDCDLTNEIISNDNSNACEEGSFQSQVSFISDGTSTYLFLIEGFSGDTGNYDISVNCEEAPTDGCWWTVRVEDTGLGDEVSWELRDSTNGNVIISGGNYDGDYVDQQIAAANGPVEFYIETMGEYGDNTPSYSIANENGVIYSGIVAGGTEITRSDLSCESTPPAPPSACEDFFVLSNDLERGTLLGTQKVATDLPLTDESFTVYGIEPSVLGQATNFEFIFYSDEDGLPGTELETKAGTIITEELTGNNLGYDFYKYTVKFDSPITLDANTTYWVEMVSDATAWEGTTDSVLGKPLAFNNPNSTGGDWVITGNGSEVVFNLICDEMSTNELNSFDFNYHPNPVKDILNISSKKSVENVSVFNLAGQKVLNNAKVSNNQVDVSALAPGTYVFKVTLEGGQIETFKIIKK